jgi:DNA-binding NtrC family response regulator
MVKTLPEEVVGVSAYACAARRFIEEARATSAPILLAGEPGTGKELAAKLIHQGSSRRKDPFLMIDCSLYYEKELKRELFGYRSGGGVDSQRKGILEFASKGTCYLSRIEELSLSLQADLLGFLSRRRFERLGDAKEIASDARIVASSDKNLEGFVQAGLFDAALYQRLCGQFLRLLPLRERKEDIPAVVDAIVAQENRARPGGAQLAFTDQALDALRAYPWPANVEELKKEVVRLLGCSLAIVRPENLSMEIAGYWLGRRGDPEVRRAIEELDGYIREFRILSRLEPCLGVLLDLEGNCAIEGHRDILEEL